MQPWTTTTETPRNIFIYDLHSENTVDQKYTAELNLYTTSFDLRDFASFVTCFQAHAAASPPIYDRMLFAVAARYDIYVYRVFRISSVLSIAGFSVGKSKISLVGESFYFILVNKFMNAHRGIDRMEIFVSLNISSLRPAFALPPFKPFNPPLSRIHRYTGQCPHGCVYYSACNNIITSVSAK